MISNLNVKLYLLKMTKDKIVIHVFEVILSYSKIRILLGRLEPSGARNYFYDI